jgi:ubiquinone/menaquinone biosynthesis C-methylase UbiE
MTRFVTHDLKLTPSRDEAAGQDFVSSLRAHVLNGMAQSMKARFDAEVAPKLPAEATSRDVLKAMQAHPYFRFYSATRVKAQMLVWDSVRETIERERQSLAERAAALAKDQSRVAGTLTLDPGLAIPRNVCAIDVHLMPGSYSFDGGDGDIAAGSLYDNGLSVFSFGLMGETLDDIGRSVARWLSLRHPDFAPADVLDLGCSVGHQTLPWKRAYPEACVTGIDVAPACLRYAHARAQSMGLEAHFRQANATALPFPDASFDLVFSSMFLHELPVKDIRAVFAEAQRLLRPGGLMLHYELPPNDAISPYDGFYLDWDSHYNAEPYYQGYRDLSPPALAAEAGFAPDRYFEAAVPSLGWYGEDAVRAAVADGGATASDKLGRLSDGVQWFVYGAWK